LVPDSSKNAVFDSVRFLALIEAAKKGELPARSPHQLYGAVAQQCLSIIASDAGRFTRVADILNAVRGRNYLDRDSIELILADLADKGYLQRHGFKNRYGASEELHPLVDYRIIYGNFGVGSQNVEVRQRSKVLGEVPVINLLRVRPGHVVRFAGRNWRVTQASREGIVLDLIHAKARATDFIYPGAALASDPYLAQSMWRLLHGDAFPSELLAPRLRDVVGRARDRLRNLCTVSQIPYTRVPGRLAYLTFGGSIVNKAISIKTAQLDPKYNDALLAGTSSVEWSTIPTSAQAFESVFDELFECSSEQSIYQKLLPERFQVQEFLEGWLRDMTVPEVLQRLSSSSPVQVPPNVVQDWAAVPS
jgi:ATP-dependent Lhr-like helicase